MSETTKAKEPSLKTGGGVITPAARIHATKTIKPQTGGGVIKPAARIHATRNK